MLRTTFIELSTVVLLPGYLDAYECMVVISLLNKLKAWLGNADVTKYPTFPVIASRVVASLGLSKPSAAPWVHSRNLQ